MAFSLIALAIIALLVLALIVLGVLSILAWSRTRSLAWRIADLEDAVRRLQMERLQTERPLPRDVVGGSTAIRE
jgi:hypothetical protein